MPCRSDYMEPTTQEYKYSREMTADFRTMADDLTYANDVLREFLLTNQSVPSVLKFVNHEYAKAFKVLQAKAQKAYVGVDSGLIKHVGDLVSDYVWLNGLVVNGKPLTASIKTKITMQQNAHREADLSRLMKVFADKGDRVRLRKVLDADATKPLEPQLGFSPDDF